MPGKVLRVGVVMDSIARINPKKDSTLAMLLAASRRGWPLEYMEQGDLSIRDGRPYARMRPLTVRDDLHDWYSLADARTAPLEELDVILMRKDPPFDMEYIQTTYVLERAALRGALVVNDPRALRDVNEKAYTAWFPEWCPPTLITRSHAEIKAFAAEHGKIVLKPLDGMGGRSIFVVQTGDLNTNVILETLTAGESRFVLAQRFLPEITATGDKRILVVDGRPVPYVLARYPVAGEHRGNLAAGGRAEPQPITDRDREIGEKVGALLVKKGLLFVGLDVIGDYLTEINVTSPTCIRELDKAYGLDIAGELMEAIGRHRAR
jgi:glutathione synthase